MQLRELSRCLLDALDELVVRHVVNLHCVSDGVGMWIFEPPAISVLVMNESDVRELVCDFSCFSDIHVIRPKCPGERRL